MAQALFQPLIRVCERVSICEDPKKHITLSIRGSAASSEDVPYPSPSVQHESFQLAVYLLTQQSSFPAFPFA
jgi:hypothetical protein